MPRLRPDEQARLDRREAERKKAAAEQNERQIRKKERELDELEASLRCDPPPELSPSERKERELVERLDRLEGRQQALAAVPRFEPTREAHENQMRDELRIRLIERDRLETEAREAADGTTARRDRFDQERRDIEARREKDEWAARDACRAQEDAIAQRAADELAAQGDRP